MNQIAGRDVRALSAGTHAKGAVNALSARSLAEVGIDVSDHRPTQLDDALVAEADLIVVVGTAAHPDVPEDGPPVEVWDTDEPSLRGIEGLDRMRLIRDDIAGRVRELAHRLPRRSGRVRVEHPQGLS
jgi:arsenate-mycothiol transferase